MSGLLGRVDAIQGRTQHLGSRLHHRDYPFIGHSGRADHAQNAQYAAIGTIWRGHQAALVERRNAAFLTDEKPHAAGAGATFQQLQQLLFTGEGVEQLAQTIQIGQVLHSHQLGLACNQHVVLFDRSKSTGGHVSGHRQQLVHFIARLAQLVRQTLANRRKR